MDKAKYSYHHHRVAPTGGRQEILYTARISQETGNRLNGNSVSAYTRGFYNYNYKGLQIQGIPLVKMESREGKEKR